MIHHRPINSNTYEYSNFFAVGGYARRQQTASDAGPAVDTMATADALSAATQGHSTTHRTVGQLRRRSSDGDCQPEELHETDGIDAGQNCCLR